MYLHNGEPIIELSGDEFLPVEGKTFVQQVEEFFQNQGGVAHSAFGDVSLDKKGGKNDKPQNTGGANSKTLTTANVTKN